MCETKKKEKKRKHRYIGWWWMASHGLASDNYIRHTPTVDRKGLMNTSCESSRLQLEIHRWGLPLLLRKGSFPLLH
jgi:hypothetical protein